MENMTTDQEEPVELKVLTLNCWGLYEPFSKFRIQRMVAIAEYLQKNTPDIVLLQEVWVKEDYNFLCTKLLKKLPYTHYFHGGMMGSGLCIFTKHSILTTFEHMFSLKGFAHKVFHGDWFAGKSVGLAVVNFNGFIINVYVTHTHADYGDPPRYKHLRVVQAFELSEFIKLTSNGCDTVIVGGDLNFQPSSLGFRMASFNAKLQDSWLAQLHPVESEEDGWTCNMKGSPFAHSEGGSRIDYLLFKSNPGIEMVCHKCETVMKEVPGEPYFHSDHAAVKALFTLQKAPIDLKEREDQKDMKVFRDALLIIHEGREIIRKDQQIYGAVFIAIIVLLVAIFSIPDFGLPWLYILPKFVLILALLFSGWMAIIACSKDINAFTAAIKDIDVLIGAKDHAAENKL